MLQCNHKFNRPVARSRGVSQFAMHSMTGGSVVLVEVL